MLKTCSGGHDRCTFQGPGSGSYHADGMNISFFLRKFANEAVKSKSAMSNPTNHRLSEGVP